jgi:hypothetical protein
LDPSSRGVLLSTKALKLQAFTKTLRALKTLRGRHVDEREISAIRKSLENGGETELVAAHGRRVFDVFNATDLIAAGFEATDPE